MRQATLEKIAGTALLPLLALLVLTTVATPAAAQDNHTEFMIQVGEDGDAEWEVRNVVPFTTDAERQAFQDLADDPSALDSRADRVSAEFGAIADRASERTGRDMELRDVSVDASIRNGEGVITVSFTWTNFVETRNGEERVGDVFDRGLPLGGDDTFTLTAPSGTTFDDVPSGATVDGNTLTIEGGTALVSSVELVSEEATDGEEGEKGIPGLTATATLIGILAAALIARHR